MKKSRLKNLTLLGKAKTLYPKSPDIARLETFDNAVCRDYDVKFETDEFTSMCPVTGQPDFAGIQIEYIPAKKCIESKSLKLYLFSFRNVGMFAEDIANRILDDIVKTAKPKKAKVTVVFKARGGIGITVEAKYGEQITKDEKCGTKDGKHGAGNENGKQGKGFKGL
ncbi:MAG: NADPH-dependent 7-cyano-7-deazaguanine reductase QueF [Candidatus Aureabacteria bacterium]|nr:NADPH-dependent 7-cyano-7-deazaguanine reductase QueF [Candidatus Auribacterota bacterium]